jgi:hypothetical protein
MTRKITIMALIAGIVLGAAATEGFNIYRQSHDSRIFQERLRCKAVADAYVKENSTDFKEDDSTAQSWVTVTLDKVDYSPARNSCVAELETTYSSQRVALANFEDLSVRDLLSGETLFSSRCIKNCEVLRVVWGDRAFDYVMKNASEPSEIERLAPSETPWDAKENPIPDAKHPPKSADHPSGR